MIFFKNKERFENGLMKLEKIIFPQFSLTYNKSIFKK